MKKKEFIFLLTLIFVFICIRSVHFTDHLFFNNDQGEQAAKVLELWNKKKLTLIGNRITSMVYEGKTLFQGPATYYFMLPFLLIGNFDPIISSYAFMIFSSFMIIPLYFGMKSLSGYKGALFIVIVYTLYPFYVPYTRFLWNPNFQFSLLPILIYIMGKYYEKKNTVWLFMIGFMLGVLFQFHYQFILILISVVLWIVLKSDKKIKTLAFILCGIGIGLFPFLLFEFRNQFYNTILAYKMITNWKDVSSAQTAKDHYYLSISFMGFVILAVIISWFQKRIKYRLFDSFYLLFMTIFIIYSFSVTAIKQFPKPKLQFWAPTEDWKYENEYKIYQIVKEANVNNFNIANLAYDTLSLAPKYLLKRDNIVFNEDDYYGNQYLFVVSRGNSYETDPAYEVATFKPRRLVKKWKLNKTYDVYLLERIKE